VSCQYSGMDSGVSDISSLERVMIHTTPPSHLVNVAVPINIP
jgi:hypothetical protein